MLREQTFEKLYSLKLHGMAQSFEQQLANPDSTALGFEERFGMLVEDQWLWRENQAIKSRLRKATLKMPASVEGINYRHARQLDRSMIQSLSNCDWIRQHHNIAISGPSGIGKTYICCALLDKACREGFSVRYVSSPKFFRRLAIAYADGSFDKMLARLAKTDVIAIDDFGLAPLADMQKQYLLEVLDDRCGSRSTVVASQFLIDKWHDLVGSPTLADAIMERFVLSYEDEERYLKIAPKFLQDIAMLILDTGLRAGEALQLEWKNVNFEPLTGAKFGFIRITEGKSKNAKRNLSLTGRVKAMLEERFENHQSEWVFPTSAGTPMLVSSLDHLHNKVRENLKLDPEFVIHSLRHTFLTRLGEAGADAFTIMKLAGHSSITMSQRYVHPTPAAMEQAMERLDTMNQEASKGLGKPSKKVDAATISAT